MPPGTGGAVVPSKKHMTSVNANVGTESDVWEKEAAKNTRITNSAPVPGWKKAVTMGWVNLA